MYPTTHDIESDLAVNENYRNEKENNNIKNNDNSRKYIN